MNTEALCVIDGAVQSHDLNFAPVAGSGVTSRICSEAAQQFIRPGLQLLRRHRGRCRRRASDCRASLRPACGVSPFDQLRAGAPGCNAPLGTIRQTRMRAIGFKRVGCLPTSAARLRAAHSQTVVIRIAGSASAQRPQKMHLPGRTWPCGGRRRPHRRWRVGQTAAAGRASSSGPVDFRAAAGAGRDLGGVAGYGRRHDAVF